MAAADWLMCTHSEQAVHVKASIFNCCLLGSLQSEVISQSTDCTEMHTAAVTPHLWKGVTSSGWVKVRVTSRFKGHTINNAPMAQ